MVEECYLFWSFTLSTYISSRVFVASVILGIIHFAQMVKTRLRDGKPPFLGAGNTMSL